MIIFVKRHYGVAIFDAVAVLFGFKFGFTVNVVEKCGLILAF